jgi:catechol 2,3-dioxygenase-like lactoylglutathione lyase family enzyme
MMDQAAGELVERRLEHESGEAQAFYPSLVKPVRVNQVLQCFCYGQILSREGSMPQKIDGILESSLYVSDVPRSVRFYQETFGFRVISEFGERGCAMNAGTRQVLLLFKKGASRATQTPHDGDGELHLAFAIPSGELAGWESWLQTKEIAVEEKKTWKLGGWSLYFRDPDRHLIELATPGTWSVY